MYVVSSRSPRPKEVTAPNGNRYLISDYLGSSTDLGDGPQAFLVEFPMPHGVIRPHFHHVPQFQVVVAGRGWLGKHELAPVAVHYADAFTPYGPIKAGAEGLTFFTLRAEADVGSQYMPESRNKMTRKAGRSLSAHVNGPYLSSSAGSEPAAQETLVAPQPDGLAAVLVRLGPESAGEGLGPAGEGGRYCLVTRGSLVHDGTELPAWSCLFLEPTDRPPRLVAGPQGADVLVLQFART